MAYEIVGLVYCSRVCRVRKSVEKAGAGGSWGNESVTVNLVLKPFFLQTKYSRDYIRVV